MTNTAWYFPRSLITATGTLAVRLLLRKNRPLARRIRNWFDRRCRRHPRWFGQIRPTVKAEVTPGVVMECDTHDRIGAKIVFDGVWEEDVTAAICALLRPCDWFLDIGANVGYHSLWASRAVGPSGRVLAFEPYPISAARLANTLYHNRIQNVSLLTVALGESSGTCNLGEPAVNNLGAVRRVAGEETVAGFPVITAPLTAVLPDEDFDRIRLIKMDIEGGELNALRGMTPLLEKYNPPYLICELDPRTTPGGSQGVAQIINFMFERGYTGVYSRGEGAKRARGWMPLNVEVYPLDKDCNACFVPPGEDPVNLLDVRWKGVESVVATLDKKNGR